MPDATTDVLGEAGLFGPGGGGAAPLVAQVDGRECVLADALFGSCRASTGAGGAFLVTAESTAEAPTTWTMVVRCGTSPGIPAASTHGDFQPQTSDVGLEPYGEVLGITLRAEVAEAALVYQPDGAECPVVWGLGEVDQGSFFTGGLDALSGSSNPIRFTDAQGVRACAVADGAGGIAVSPCPESSVDAEQLGPVLPADRAQPVVAQVEPGEALELVGVGVRDGREVGAEQDLVARSASRGSSSRG